MYARDIWATLEEINNDVTEKPKRPLNRNYRTYVTGHSLGGAAAVILVLYLYQEKPTPFNISGAYRFGQPRVFDNHGATSWPHFAKKVYQVENCQDPIPLLRIGDNILSSFIIAPLSSKSEREEYQHMGQEIILLNPNEFWMPARNELVRRTTVDLEDVYRDIQRDKPTDYDIAEYLARLRAHHTVAATPVNPAYFLPENCGVRLPEVKA
jgi:triacylglycerol lipase